MSNVAIDVGRRIVNYLSYISQNLTIFILVDNNIIVINVFLIFDQNNLCVIEAGFGNLRSLCTLEHKSITMSDVGTEWNADVKITMSVNKKTCKRTFKLAEKLRIFPRWIILHEVISQFI